MTDVRSFTSTLSLPFTVSSWWNMQMNMMGLSQQFNLIYNKSPVTIEQAYVRLTWMQNFTLPKQFTIQASGFYQSSGFFGMAVLDPFGSVDFGFRKKLDHERGSLNFDVTNTFNTNKWYTSINLPEQNLVSKLQIQF